MEPTHSDGRTHRQDRLATLGGFVRRRGVNPRRFLPTTCTAIAASGRYAEIDIYHEWADRLRAGTDERTLVTPATPPVAVYERRLLPTQAERYGLIYVANEEQRDYAPHLLRPVDDWAPIVCDIGAPHATLQWTYLFGAAAARALRPTDGFAYASVKSQRLFERIWSAWSARIGPLPLPRGEVVPNGVDLDENQRDDALREPTRRELGLAPSEVALLWFGRFGVEARGEPGALIALWKEVVARSPNAVLVVAGMTEDRWFVQNLETDSRLSGTRNRILILGNLFAQWKDVKKRLFSAVDVVLHPSTEIEDGVPSQIEEAMAYGLPVIASRWSGAEELVVDGETGFLVDTYWAPTPVSVRTAVAARPDPLLNAEIRLNVALDPVALVDRCASLACDAELRRRFGAAAQRSIASRSIQAATRHRICFFDEISRGAEAAWTGAEQPIVPFVDVDHVLEALATRPIAPTDRLALVERARVQSIRDLRDGSTGALVEQILGTLERAGPQSARALAVGVQKFAGLDADELDPEVWSLSARILLRLLNFHVVELRPAE